MRSKQNIWALQLLRYLISTKGYLQMSVKTNFVDVEKRVEYWLVNTKDSDYTIVHITDQSDNERKQTMPADVAMFEKVLEVVGKKDGRVLDISLSQQASSYYVENIRYINLYPGCSLDETLAAQFPELSTVIHDVDGDLGKAERTLEAQIKLASIAAMKEARKAAIKKNFAKKSKTTSIFKIIAAICVLVYAAVNLSALYLKTDSINTAVALGAYYKSFVVVLNDYWRLLTAGFVHCNILHLLCNLSSFAYLSRTTEMYLGSKKTLLILLAAIIVGNACVFIGDKNIVGVGLSGGLYGLLGATLVISIQRGWFASSAYTKEFLQTAMMNIFISLLPNVSFLAHLGGLVTGIFLAYILSDETDKAMKINCIVCGVVVLAAVGFLMYKNAHFTQFYYGTDQYVAKVYESFGLKGYSKNILEKCLEYYMSHGG